MAHGQDDSPVTNGVHNGTNGVTKAKTLPKSFDSISETVKAFERGEFVIVLDGTHRENEGDLIIAAQDCTPSKLSFMIRYTSGYVCAPLSTERADALNLPLMVPQNNEKQNTAYTITIDAAAPGMTTGISARDRACTANTLADPRSGPDSFRRPGHVLPLRAKPGLVRERFGHTEAAVELCRLAGKEPAAFICEMVLDGEEVEGVAEREGGGMMRRDDCLEFGRKWGLKVCTIEDLVEYVEAKEGKLEKPGTDY